MPKISHKTAPSRTVKSTPQASQADAQSNLLKTDLIKITVRFTEHDLRAKCASDASSLEHARALLSHADPRTTDAIYRRKPEHVKPLTKSLK